MTDGDMGYTEYPTNGNGIKRSVTDAEAVADGFPGGTSEMRQWLEKSHGHFNASTIFNKITLRRGGVTFGGVAE